MSSQARQWHLIPNGDKGAWRASFVRGQRELDAKTTRTPTGSMEQQQRPARPGAAAAPGTPSRSAPARPGAAAAPGTPSRSGPSAQPRNVAPGAPQGATSRTPTQAPKSESEKAAIQKRAEGRALVPLQFRDSFKHFFFSPTGMLKIFRLGLLIGALVCFVIARANEPFIAITVLEICIVLFFILIYMLTLQHLLVNLDWPLLDLVNSFITAVFLLIVAILAMQEMERRHLFYVGGTQCLTAAIVCILDGIMVTKKITDKMRRMLGLEYESSSSLLLEPKKSGPTPAPGKAGTPGSSKPPTPAASKPPVAAPAKAPTQGPTSAARRTSSRGSSKASSKTSTIPSSRASSLPPSRTGASVPRPSR
ncbi:CKLF-like MARVEL transmembrane domain-containing protein 2 [Neomonachus schauinslandi]|uniref:CKLF-like MARVEL transmembrane domain-containing protein 2 n=1 Tax=Neomonachus schauinslandi TaxID=29088 RepID=A0A2Y9IFT9_NEOSC|nr:CKLF-like MARVEL transmembrane domain-containing protein 2 [Neomonachus schauinslandi]